MRAPRFVRDFFEWRWATCIALIVGALMFVLCALLLIPAQLDPVRVDAMQRTALDASTVAPPSPRVAARDPIAAVPVVAAPVPVAVPEPEPTITAAEPAPGNSPERATLPDFQQNIEDRADRPTRPRERLQ